MPRILVLYYSSYGHVRALAEAEAEGARGVPGSEVDIRRVPETVPEAVRISAGYVEDDTPVAQPADMAELATPRAHLVLSGLLTEQAPRVLAAYRATGFVLKRRLIRGNWATLILGRG